MTDPDNARRTVVIKASRDTLLLIACAVSATLAISYAVHTRPASVSVAEVAPPQQEWAGTLADVTTQSKSVQPAETMTSASLVVPPAALSLPKEPSRAAPQKPRACDPAPCVVKPGAQLPLPPVRQKPAAVETAAVQTPVPAKDEASLVGRLNPLNHLPDAVRHPFDYAGNTVSGWMKRL